MFLNGEKNYKGFELISIVDVPDCSSTGIYLRHSATGLEVFHLLNDDTENLFAFSFRTPVKDSTGAAHILEHSVFCGSEKFPLKEPFANLMNQSVNTFLNAMTYSDKTVYPASSMVEADYFNLMDVYGGAVFFPLLRKEAFMQEAHRLEFDENGKPVIQGVVYNEMKGVYSSFESVAGDFQLSSLFPNTNYAFDSGGDPLSIADFSYQDFQDFHKEYYRPDNCLLFLYGNITTEKQLDFVQEKILNRLEQKFVPPEKSEFYPNPDKNFMKMETVKPFLKPAFIKGIAPATGAAGSIVSVNWLCGKSTDLQSFIECTFLAEVLTGNDGSPMTSVLISSGLGDDLAPITGCAAEHKNFIFSLGLKGVKKWNTKKVYSLIINTLKSICEKGIEQNVIDAALLAADFSTREIVRSGGPYSIILLERCLQGWNYGVQPAPMLLYREAIEVLKSNLNEDKDFIKKLIQKYLLDNVHRTYVCVSPSKKFLKDREKKEKLLCKKMQTLNKKEDIIKENEILYNFQNRQESEEEISCIPSIELSDLKAEADIINTEVFSLKDDDENSPPILLNREKTNGVAYFSVCIPIDFLEPQIYEYLPFFSACAANAGWNGKKWDECSLEAASVSGGISVRIFSANISNTEKSDELKTRFEKYNFTQRDWLIFSIKMTSEKIKDAFSVFGEAFSTYEFSDTDRLKLLLSEMRSTISSSIIPRGSRYAMNRCQSPYSHAAVCTELWSGISQLISLEKFSRMEISIFSEKFTQLSKRLKDAGAILHLTADSETADIALPFIRDFSNKYNLHKPLTPSLRKTEELKKLILFKDQTEFLPIETFKASAQIGFASSVIPGSSYGTKEYSEDLVFAHWFSGTKLWEKIRTTGGAYGAYAGCEPFAGLFKMYTFRDPTPEKSLKTFMQCLEEAKDTVVSEEDCRRHIAGTYGDEVQPHSPAEKGHIGFIRCISCISDEDKKAKIEGILSVSPKDLQNSATRFFNQATKKREVLICGKSVKSTGFIMDLPV